jgi:hypothetical protein
MIEPNQMQKFYEVQILHPTMPCENLYRFESEIIETNEEVMSTTITRMVEICFSGKENNLWRYQLICSEYDIIAEHIGNKTILKKTAGIFDEIKVLVNQNGSIVSVLNLDEMQQYWETEKQEMLEKNQGGNLLDFLDRTDGLIANQESVMKFITSKDCYGLYFNSCWGVHDTRKPRFEGLTIHIEKRVQEDRHNQDLQKIYKHDALLEFKKVTEEKQQESEFTYENHHLKEAFLSIEAPNLTSKYSIVCLI